ncbi:MAG TPA: response regulator [candidate division Zixibacteria bacterium]|nr:response regulator [candidate division Zixibacteria bacterium]
MANDTVQGSGRRLPRAFVVEDDFLTLQLLREVARSVGLEPVAFTHLSSVRRALRDQAPAVLVVDDDLPDGQGADLVRELRANPHTRHVRVVFCTAADHERRRDLGRMAPVVSKPFRVEELEHLLAEAAATH